ncbi:hypothetical protein Ancab_031828 [Ancistrocladus abbreviatus]
MEQTQALSGGLRMILLRLQDWGHRLTGESGGCGAANLRCWTVGSSQPPLGMNGRLGFAFALWNLEVGWPDGELGNRDCVWRLPLPNWGGGENPNSLVFLYNDGIPAATLMVVAPNSWYLGSEYLGYANRMKILERKRERYLMSLNLNLNICSDFNIYGSKNFYSDRDRMGNDGTLLSQGGKEKENDEGLRCVYELLKDVDGKG